MPHNGQLSYCSPAHGFANREAQRCPAVNFQKAQNEKAADEKTLAL
jgi:hypothetical protein